MRSVTIKHRGVTFVELLIVIVIIGILVGVSVPQFRKTYDNIALEDFVRDIYYLSLYLQASATADGRIYYLGINKEEGKFKAAYKEQDKLNPPPGKFGRDYIAPQGTVISTVPQDKAGVFFYPDGSIEQITITFENQHENKISIVTKGAVGEIKIQ